MRTKQITYKQRKLIEAMTYVGVHDDFEGDTFGQAGKYIRENMEEYDRLKLAQSSMGNKLEVYVDGSWISLKRG